MTPQAEKELNERLLKKIGFKPCINGTWQAPDKSGYFGPLTVPDLLHDINVCFRWLVPELRKQGCEVVSFYYNLKNIDCDLTPANHATATIESSADTESTALCLAADKFLKE